MGETSTRHSVPASRIDGISQRSESRQPSNLNLRHNDNSFHVLASILVEFFLERLSQDNGRKTITLQPDDREILQRLLPRSAVWDFIDAVNYRLEVTPVIAVSPIHFLSLQCQELCFDSNDQDKNPILITYSLKQDPITLNLVAFLSDVHAASVFNGCSSVDDDFALVDVADANGDGFTDPKFDSVGTSSDVSSEGSTFKVASSKDIAEEMLADDETKENVNMLSEDGPMVQEESPAETGFQKSTSPIQSIKLSDEPICSSVNSKNDKGNASDVSSDGSTIKIASSRDIAEEMLAEGTFPENGPSLYDESTTKTGIDKSASLIHGIEAGDEPICTTVKSNDDRSNSSDVSSEGSAIKIASSRDVAEEMQAEGRTNGYAEYTLQMNAVSLLENETLLSENETEKPAELVYESEVADEELVIVEKIETSVVKISNEESVPELEKNIITSDFASSDMPSLAVDYQRFENDENRDEGEEIEVLPTLTYSYDEGISADQYRNDKIVGSKDVMEARNTSIAPLPTVQNENLSEDLCSNIAEYSCLEEKENVATSNPMCEPKIDELCVSEESAVQPTLSPVSETANKTVVSINSVSRSIQEAAGTFFEDIRWAIDEKIIAFEDAVVDAIVAKPSKKEKFDFNQDSTYGCENVSEHDTLGTQKEFENIVREQIPDLEPQKRMKSPSEQYGLSSFFGAMSTGFSPSASEKTSHNGLTFPSDEGSAIGSHLSVPDMAHYDAMNVVDTTTKQQLLLETKEALTLMKQSITPETTRFWRDHIQSLQHRLESLRLVPAKAENDVNALPMDSRNIDISRQQAKSSVETVNRESPTDLSDVRSIFGIPVVPGFFSDSSNAQDSSSSNAQVAPLDTQVSYKLPPTEEAVNWNPYPRSNPEIELCESGAQKNREELDHYETGHITSAGIEHFDSDYEYPLVDVVAPADLPGGYHFEAEIEGQRFLATVPPGGVQQGETFTCYMRELDSVAIDIPVGDWKDGICNMCELGWCHPVLWNSLFCPLIALGQIQTRVNLDFLGRPKFNDLPYSNRFMMLIVVGFWLFTNVGLFAACNVKWSHGLELSVADVCAFVLVNVAMFGFVVFVTQSTRSSVREKFMIRERQCYDLEDVCCATLCLPCTVGQMSRHTANYDDYEAVCCSKTGLPNGVRVNQEPAKVKETTTENKDGYMV